MDDDHKRSLCETHQPNKTEVSIGVNNTIILYCTTPKNSLATYTLPLFMSPWMWQEIEHLSNRKSSHTMLHL